MGPRAHFWMLKPSTSAFSSTLHLISKKGNTPPEPLSYGLYEVSYSKMQQKVRFGRKHLMDERSEVLTKQAAWVAIGSRSSIPLAGSRFYKPHTEIDQLQWYNPISWP